MECHPTPSHDAQKLLIRRHINRIRQHNKFGSSLIVVIPENNMGLEHSHIEKFIRNMPNVVCYSEDGNSTRVGIRKTHDNTNDYQIEVESALMKRSVFFEATLFTVSKRFLKENEDIRVELQEELQLYHWETEMAKDNFGRDRIVLTGKIGGRQDDLYMAFAMAIFWGKVIERQRRGGMAFLYGR
jgi:hypothetical protein